MAEDKTPPRAAENRVDPQTDHAQVKSAASAAPHSTTIAADKKPGEPTAFTAANVAKSGQADRTSVTATDIKHPEDAGQTQKAQEGIIRDVPGKQPNEAAQPQAHDVPLQEAVQPAAASPTHPMHYTHSRQRVTQEKADLMGAVALRAVASDRGYNLGEVSKGGVVGAFMKAQDEDKSDLHAIPTIAESVKDAEEQREAELADVEVNNASA